MKVLYVGGYQFELKDSKIYSTAAYGDAFWQKYLCVFDEIKVLGYPYNGTQKNQLSLITHKNFEVELLPKNNNPIYFYNDRRVKEIIEKSMQFCDCMIIKPNSRKGITALKLAKKYKKPYMIEITGDINSSLRESKNILRRIYRPFLYNSILNSIKNSRFGLYVTKEYLQTVYPIDGYMCGCSDVVIPYVDEHNLNKRIERINNRDFEKEVILGLIGTYSNNRKGIDTAIKAITTVPKAKLKILGFGTKLDQEKWIKYASNYHVEERLIFDNPVNGVEKVFDWIDHIDISILPSRSEGLPRSVVESLSRACPCIISNVCGMPELVNSKWLHSPEDSNMLSKLINEMISNKILMKQVAKENFEKSKEYTRENLEKVRYDFLMSFRDYVEKYQRDLI